MACLYYDYVILCFLNLISKHSTQDATFSVFLSYLQFHEESILPI